MGAFQPAGASQPEFLIHVRTARDITWQGEVVFLGAEQPEPFESLLGLIGLLEDWMDAHDTPLRSDTLRSWGDEEGSLKKQIGAYFQALDRARRCDPLARELSGVDPQVPGEDEPRFGKDHA